jgi:hypothetical protein
VTFPSLPFVFGIFVHLNTLSKLANVLVFITLDKVTWEETNATRLTPIVYLYDLNILVNSVFNLCYSQSELDLIVMEYVLPTNSWEAQNRPLLLSNRPKISPFFVIIAAVGFSNLHNLN